MSNESAIKSLEKNIQLHKDTVELGLAIDRLQNNRDFKKVIGESYFEKEPIRLVMLKADSNMQTEALQSGIVKQMDAIGSLMQYFRATQQRSAMAERSIAADEETISDLIAEGREL